MICTSTALQMNSLQSLHPGRCLVSRKHRRASAAAMGLRLPLEVAPYWKQHLLSDMDVSLELPSRLDQTATTDEPGLLEAADHVVMENPNTSVLRKIPAHKIVLSNSPYFKAQILRWLGPTATSSTNSTDAVGSGGGGSSSSSTHQPVNDKPVLSLVLQHPSQEPTAMAVLAALYGVSEADHLSQEQLLQAAVLADMWQLPDVATAAVELLVNAAKGRGLSEAATKAFLDLEVVPNFLLPLFSAIVSSGVGGGKPAVILKPLLLRVLGDLEDVWADAALRDVLLKLPVDAMEVLLSCDELKVASEDTVLYTAQRYVDAVKYCHHRVHSTDWEAAQQQLAPLIRCPYLSSFWLSAAAVSDDAPNLLLSQQQAQVRQLHMLRQTVPTFELTAADLEGLLPRAPSSWGLPQRVSKEVSSVQMVWSVDFEEIRATAQSGFSLADGQQEVTDLFSECDTPPPWVVWFLSYCCA